MKLLFCNGRSLTSRLIKWGTKSAWSHVGIFLDADESGGYGQIVLESQYPYGVRAVPLYYYQSKYKGEVWFADVPNFKESDLNRLKDNCAFTFGDPYSWGEIAVLTLRYVFGIRIKYHVARTQYICSEWVLLQLRWFGLNLCPDMPITDTSVPVTPGHVAHSPLLTNWRRIF